MKVRIQPSELAGTVYAAASKSAMQRACAAALLVKGKSVLHNPGHSNDDQAAMHILEHLGVKVEEVGEDLVINSQGILPIASQINTGESGLSIRMFTPIVAMSEHEIVINGEGSLKSRPMGFFDEVLPKLGVKIRTHDGKLPLHVQGPLIPQNITIDGSLSSQFLTGLLMAYAAADAKDVTISVTNLKSKPYIDLTLHVMEEFGMKLPRNDNYEHFYFGNESHTEIEEHEYTVEADWSGGAFLLVAGVIAGNGITVRGLDLNSAQADKKIMDALIDANASVAEEAKGIKLRKGPLKAFSFDATHCPDLFPPLVALAAYCQGETKIKGVGRLIFKESNRALTLQEEFRKMGVQIDLVDDEMIVHGGKGVKGAVVHSRHDHRIAMATAVAGLAATGETIVEEAQAVNKSYPDIYEHLRQLGGNVSGDFSFSSIKL